MNGYIIKDQIRQTKVSTVYLAEKNKLEAEKTSLTYLIKKYNTDISEELIENEQFISQTIEENCPVSVIIPILESFQCNEERYVVMQFRKNGVFLNQLIRILEEKYGSGKIPIKIVLEITSKILKSLEYFHEFESNGKKTKYLHLDLNPGNIFFESANPEKEIWGETKFIDFGSSVDYQNKNEILKKRKWNFFTSGYSAPEIEENLISHIIPSTDLYSVCACMVRMLTGKTYRRIDGELLEKIIKDSDFLISVMVKQIIANATCIPSYYRYKDAHQMKNDIDELLKCISYIDEGQYYQLLLFSYEKSIPTGQILKKDNRINESGFVQSVLQLKDDLRGNSINYGRCLYIFEILLNLSKQYHFDDLNINRILLESGLSCYNYTGQTMKVLSLYEDLLKMDYTSLESYITIKLRYAVAVADCYQFDKAYQIVYELIQGIESLKEATHISGNTGIIELGRAYSAAGTYLAFQKKNGSLEMYQKALNEFKLDKGNCDITISKILHFAVEKRDQELFEQYASVYFSTTDIASTETLKQLFKPENYSSFKFFLYLKSIDAFYWEKIDSDFLLYLDKFFSDESNFRKEHPEQMILKYGAFLFSKYGKYEKSEKYINRSLLWIPKGKIRKGSKLNLLMLISYQTQWIVNEMKGREKENQKLLNDLLERSKESPWEFLHQKLCQEKSLSHLLNHEYY